MTTGATEAVSMAWTPQRVRVTAGLMLAIFVSAMDSSVVATAVPTIAGDLGSFALYPWLISGYLLTSTTTVPLWGRLADLYGRRRVVLAGLAWFVVASLLCAAAPDMAWLVAFRALQGIGAGCLLPVAFTMIGDLFSLEQRARIQGVFSSVWAVAALAGPTLGAAFVSTVGWRWIFWINLPAGLIGAVLLWGHRDAPPAGERGRLDYAGAITLTAGIGLLLFGLNGGGGGQTPAWPLVALGLAALAVFAVIQRRTDHPTIPFALLRHRVIGPATAAAFLAGTLMFAMGAFLPLYVQGVRGGSSFLAGAVVSAGSLGWTATALFSGYVMLRVGYQRLVVTGALSMVIGAIGLVVRPAGAGAAVDVAWLAAAAFVIGLGMGQLQTPLLIVIQSVVDWRSRGTATALNQFSRTIGGAIGVSLLGLLLGAQARAAATAHGVDPAAVANPLSRGGHLGPATTPLVADALQAVFWVLLAIATATLGIGVAILLVNRGRTDIALDRTS
ncbi:MAG TPA: MDR family MFS transporter [Candidatus Dormibacteraeota bacterium]|nr:MDR family MFS transporter [Candidatus Dormibacteraeota bacterium]